MEIRDPEHYAQALRRIDELLDLDPPPGTAESEEYLALLDAVDRYEARQAEG